MVFGEGDAGGQQHLTAGVEHWLSRPDLAPGELAEPDRGLVDAVDRVDNIGQLKVLARAGYNGFVSMEPFSPLVQQSPGLLAQLKESLARVRQALSG